MSSGGAAFMAPVYPGSRRRTAGLRAGRRR
jgi:hypothetical protein